MSHTPEPWPEPITVMLEWSVPFGDPDAYATFERRADAIRAVECVNACAGMSDPAKEIQSMREALKLIAETKCVEIEPTSKTCVENKMLPHWYCGSCLAKHTLKNL